MAEEEKKKVRIEKITIKNFKAIDELTLEFPPPRLEGDPDIFVIGSRNGVGKTSVLEACILSVACRNLLPAHAHNPLPRKHILFPYLRSNRDNIHFTVKRSQKRDNELLKYSINIDFNPQPESPFISVVSEDNKASYHTDSGVISLAYNTIASLSQTYFEPIVFDPFLFFHSFRRITEAKTRLPMSKDKDDNIESAMINNKSEKFESSLKKLIVNAILNETDVFEDTEGNPDIDESMIRINEIMRKYTNGEIEKLKRIDRDRIDIRVSPRNGEGSYSFDGLSSGQKEIISTLFLTWKYTKDSPSIVLIDEPELHLNPEWHKKILHDLHSIAPWNQYIVATHSEHVFDAVDEDRRVILTGNGRVADD